MHSIKLYFIRGECVITLMKGMDGRVDGAVFPTTTTTHYDQLDGPQDEGFG